MVVAEALSTWQTGDERAAVGPTLSTDSWRGDCLSGDQTAGNLLPPLYAHRDGCHEDRRIGRGVSSVMREAYEGKRSCPRRNKNHSHIGNTYLRGKSLCYTTALQPQFCLSVNSFITGHRRCLFVTLSRHHPRSPQPIRGLRHRLDENHCLPMPWLFDDNLPRFVSLLSHVKSYRLRVY